MALLSDSEITGRLEGSDWQRDGEQIVREWRFADFRAALDFVNRVGEAAERVNHHPDVLLHSYKRVRLTLCTHSAGGLTDADFSLAETIDGLA